MPGGSFRGRAALGFCPDRTPEASGIPLGSFHGPWGHEVYRPGPQGGSRRPGHGPSGVERSLADGMEIRLFLPVERREMAVRMAANLV